MMMQKLTAFRLAAVGGAALVCAGALATAMDQEAVSGPAPVVHVAASKMTLGDTETPTSPPSVLVTPIAQPVLKATVPCGFTAQC